MEECVFCKIVSGQLPAHKVYEDNKTLAFLDIHPANDGHTLLIPKKHYEDIFDVPAEELAYLHTVGQKISRAIKTAVKAEGINITQSNGRAAMQEVPHLHIHLIPRFEGDGVMHGLLRRGDDSQEALNSSAEKIMAVIE